MGDSGALIGNGSYHSGNIHFNVGAPFSPFETRANRVEQWQRPPPETSSLCHDNVQGTVISAKYDNQGRPVEVGRRRSIQTLQGCQAYWSRKDRVEALTEGNTGPVGGSPFLVSAITARPAPPILPKSVLSYIAK